MKLRKEETEKITVPAQKFAEENGLEVIYDPQAEGLALSSLSVNRPGLLLSGFDSYFASSRVQVLGKSEITYIKSLEPETRKQRLESLFSKNVPCVIVSRGQTVPKDIIEAARKYKTALFGSDKITALLVNDLTDYLIDLFAPSVSLHGIMLDVYGMGVLITGESGIGKSETALELVHRGHRLVSDDLVKFKRLRDEIFGEAPAIIKHMMEIRGLGIIDVKAMYGAGAVKKRKRLELVIELSRDIEKEFNRVGNISLSQPILGLEIPKYLIPIMPGRNIAILIEVAVRDFILKQDGYNTLAEIEKRMEQGECVIKSENKNVDN